MWYNPSEVVLMSTLVDKKSFNLLENPEVLKAENIFCTASIPMNWKLGQLQNFLSFFSFLRSSIFSPGKLKLTMSSQVAPEPHGQVGEHNILVVQCLKSPYFTRNLAKRVNIKICFPYHKSRIIYIYIYKWRVYLRKAGSFLNETRACS